MVNLARDLFGGRFVAQGTPPRRLPKSLADAYGLRECKVIRVFPKSNVDRLDEAAKARFSPEFSLRRLVDDVGESVDGCIVGPGGLVEVRLASARVRTRFPGEEQEKHASFSLLICGGFPGTAEQNRLLQVLSQSLGCGMYDSAWNNRIHWDDPYYSLSANSGGRPGVPRNASPVE